MKHCIVIAPGFAVMVGRVVVVADTVAAGVGIAAGAEVRAAAVADTAAAMASITATEGRVAELVSIVAVVVESADSDMMAIGRIPWVSGLAYLESGRQHGGQ